MQRIRANKNIAPHQTMKRDMVQTLYAGLGVHKGTSAKTRLNKRFLTVNSSI